jgi:hypothetical protein
MIAALAAPVVTVTVTTVTVTVPLGQATVTRTVARSGTQTGSHDPVARPS